jgi:DNA-binding MarR family transcriptional regulator
MPKLNDSQLVILSAAAQRDDGAVLPLSKSLKIKGAALTKTLDQLRKQGLLEEKPAPHGAATWREGEDGGRMMLVITPAGVKALESEITSATPHSRSAKSHATKRRKTRAAVHAKHKPQNPAPTRRAGTKQSVLIGLLQRKSGATIDDIVAATGWQAHSVRGAISGVLKKKLGLAISSDKAERGRIYRIAGRA